MTSTSVKLRQLSSFKVAKWYIPLSALCWIIFYVHIWVGYSGYQSGTACKRRDGTYTIFITVCTVTIDACAPIIIMIIFSLLTLNNLYGLHRRRSRITPIGNGIRMIEMGTTVNNNRSIQTLPSNQTVKREKKKIDKQLTLISLIQVVLYIMFNTLSASYSVYSTATSTIVRSANRAAIESFISTIGVLLTFIYGTVSKLFISMKLNYTFS